MEVPLRCSGCQEKIMQNWGGKNTNGHQVKTIQKLVAIQVKMDGENYAKISGHPGENYAKLTDCQVEIKWLSGKHAN